ncbi:hypothetical protein NIES2109_63150 (plasmid) [Nostoc sp. HK-01]|nr:hypothetical protein NIES2109_63150 [Nostoc sp. HK-01]
MILSDKYLLNSFNEINLFWSFMLSINGFLLSLLNAEVSIKNIKILWKFLTDRFRSKPIILSVKAPDGRELSIQASSREAFEYALRQAQEFLNKRESPDDIIIEQFKEKGKNYLKHREIAQRFFEQAGAKVSEQDQYSLLLTSVPQGLKLLPPVSVLISDGVLTKDDVSELVKKSRQPIRTGFDNTAILLYQEPPDTIVRLRIAEVRLEDNFMIIPISLAEAENSLSDSRICEAVFTEYVNRYIKRANFFDDKNAISDTVSFFGRIELLNRLKEELLGYQAIGLFGLRKSGKTSILYQLSFLLRNHPIVRIDLQQYTGYRYGADLFNDILRQLSTLVRNYIPEYSPNFEYFISSTPTLEITNKFVKRIHDLTEALQLAGYQLPILCLMDEVERILPNSNHPIEKVEEFNACFGALRVLCQDKDKRNLSLIVADVHPDCNRINNWPQDGVSTNPVFSFFKEIYLYPFSEQETVEMLTSIAEFMGLNFDSQTPIEIHKESGGHPFIARQLARFLTQMIPEKGIRSVDWSMLQPALDNLVFDFDELSNYFEKSIWEDLEKRDFKSALSILKILATNEGSGQWIENQFLLGKLTPNCTLRECHNALKWLVAVGIIDHQQVADNTDYRIRILHFSRWIRMQMTKEELQQWKID